MEKSDLKKPVKTADIRLRNLGCTLKIFRQKYVITWCLVRLNWQKYRAFGKNVSIGFCKNKTILFSTITHSTLIEYLNNQVLKCLTSELLLMISHQQDCALSTLKSHLFFKVLHPDRLVTGIPFTPLNFSTIFNWQNRLPWTKVM